MKHVSATQVKMFDRCNRKWWWRYVQKMAQPPTPAMTLGTAVHLHVEEFLTGVAEIPEDSLAKAAEPILEKTLSDDILVEHKISMPVDNTGIKFIGQADIIDLGGDIPRVIDIKTTSSISRWAAKPRTLSRDVQMNVYAHAVLVEFAPEAKEIEVSHVYVQTRGATKSKKVRVLLSRDHVESMWGTIKDSVYRMGEIYDEQYQNSIPANVRACNDFGGCPYANHCIAAKTKKKEAVNV
jgi:CRISPR/Cas system-associated exonuclease Cas4 (RecB family)